MLSFMRDDEIKNSQPEGQNVQAGGSGFEDEQSDSEQDYVLHLSINSGQRPVGNAHRKY